MILNLAPLRSYHLDTISSLNVSSRAKRIEVREIENEVVFKQPPKKSNSSILGTSMHRQPLRPLANAHNTQINGPVQKPGDKKPKAFSVYTDTSKASGVRPSNGASAVVRTTIPTNKRPLESQNTSRPVKVARVNPISRATDLSASKIEEMIERKVQEALANRVLDQPSAKPPTEISEAVQRRLEALEKKIESGEAEETRAEGLRFLLMAKQHKERGEDASALKMYELATPYFPNQQKLQSKIENLKAKIQARKVDIAASATVKISTDVVRETHRSLATAPIKQISVPAATYDICEPTVEERSGRQHARHDENETEDEYDELAVQAEESHDESFSYRTPKPKKSRTKPKAKASLHIFKDVSDESRHTDQTPRTQQLLDIVNSRDVALIQGLAGVGKKKANDLVEFLALQDGDDGGNLMTLEQLMRAPGMGSKTVDKAYSGIGAALFV